ncbi:MAG: phosphate signaling complex protein PhoU [Ruminococcus sp.]|nr:phosphate signaling complex protein PhoU [Ruminococcus sp.]
MRNFFDSQLEQLNLELINMGALCESAIASAVKALSERNLQLVEKTNLKEREIDRKERDIENLCLKLLLKQQPVARDLRTISSALKMISDMERIGDQASDIAEIARFAGGQPADHEIHILDMAEKASDMVTTAIDSFVKKDLSLALSVIGLDNGVDELFVKVRNEIVAMVKEDNTKGEHAMDLLMIAKYLERIGDHAVNISEWVVYSITGSHNGEEEQLIDLPS